LRGREAKKRGAIHENGRFRGREAKKRGAKWTGTTNNKTNYNEKDIYDIIGGGAACIMCRI